MKSMTPGVGICSALLAGFATLGGCGATETVSGDPEETAALIREMELESVPSIRVTGAIRIYRANTRYATTRVGTDWYLLETENDCPALVEAYTRTHFPDFRGSPGRIRAGIDTIRDCRIIAIHRLPPEEPETTDDNSGPIQTQEP